MVASEIISAVMQHDHGSVPILVGFVSTCLVGSALLEWILSVVFVRQPPTTVALFCYGMFLSYLCESFALGTLAEGVRIVERTDPNVIFYILLPMFLYESSATLNFHVFRRNLQSALLLAGPGAVITMVLMAIAIKLIVKVDWIISFLISSVLSATDPVAVIASLHQLNAPEKLASLVDGESLLNDGAAVVFFEVFRTIIASGGSSFSKSMWIFIRLALGGPFVGFAMGFLISVWLKAAQSLGGVQIIGVTASVYFVFFIAHELQTSGVLATVVFGLFMSAWAPTCFRPKTQESHLHFVKIFAHLANHLIFVLSGVVTMRIFRPFLSMGVMWFNLGAVYLAMNIVRGIMVVVLLPFIRKSGSDLSFKEAVILIYGGLRGGVCMALAMVFEGDTEVPEHIRAQVAFYIAGAVSLSLLVNGSTVEGLYRKLKIYAVQNFRKAFLIRVMESIDEEYNNAFQELKNHWFLENHPDALRAANSLVPVLQNGYLDAYGDFHMLLTPPAHAFARLKAKSMNYSDKYSRYNDDVEEGKIHDEFIGSSNEGKERSRSALIGVDGLDIDQRCWNIIATSVKMAKSQQSVASSARESMVQVVEDEDLSYSNKSQQSIKDDISPNSEEAKLLETTPLVENNSTLSIKNSTSNDDQGDVKEDPQVLDQIQNNISKGRSPTFAPLIMATGSLHMFVEQELLVCNMVFNTCWQSYDLMFRRHIISGTALLTLKKAINKANHIGTNDSNGSFMAEWNSIRKDLKTPSRNKQKTFNFVWQTDFERVMHDMEVLFAFLHANKELIKAGGFEVECLLGASLIDSFRKRLALAKAELTKIKDNYFNYYVLGVAVIATNMLLNVKEQIVLDEMTRGVLLEEDEEKITDILEQQRIAIEEFITKGVEAQLM